MQNKQELVKEFIIEDGIGAQLWRKIYAMSYAKYHGLVFQDTPITNFLIHESDKVSNEEEKIEFIKNFLSVINNPWKDYNFTDLSNFILCDKVGAGLPLTQGIIPSLQNFTKLAPTFSNIDGTNNEIVIHIRRGNVIKENPRWIDEDVYINLIKSIPSMLDKLNISVDQISIITDASDNNKMYKPINDDQMNKWNQPYLNRDENGYFPVTTINFELLKSYGNNIKIYNNLSTYDAFIKMVKAKILIVSRSAFSQTAGLLSKHIVIEMFDSHNQFMGSSGFVNRDGTISIS